MGRTSKGSQIRPSKIFRGSKTEVTEFVVETDGLSFGIIYGECESGYFIAIPNFGVSVLAAAPDDTFYNRERLRGCKNKLVADSAGTLACAIMKYFEEDKP